MKADGHTAKEIAEAIGFSESAVKKRFYRRSATTRAPAPAPTPQQGTPTPHAPVPSPAPGPPAAAAPAPEESTGSSVWGSDPWGTFQGEFHELFDHVLKTLEAPKNKRQMAVNMVKLNPTYHTEDQIRSLLIELKVHPNLAVRAAQVTMSMFYQQSQGYQQPYGAPPPMGRPPLPPLMAPPPHGYPPQPPPGYPPHPGYPPYPPQGYGPHYNPYYPPPPPTRPAESSGETMTKAEFDAALKEAEERMKRENELKSQNDELQGQINELGNLVVSLKDKLDAGPATLRIPVRDAAGNVMVSPAGDVVYEEIPAGYNPQGGGNLEAQMISLMENTMNRVLTIQGAQNQLPQGMSEHERELIVAKNKNAILEVQKDVTAQFQALQNENKMLQNQLATAGQSGLSEDGHIMVAEIQARGKHIEAGINTVNGLLNGLMTTFNRAMQVEQHPSGYNQIPQWTNAEATAAANRFMEN